MLHFEGDGLVASERLDEDLHASSQMKHVQGGLHLDVVVGESAAVFQLLAGGKDQTLLVRRNALLILDLLLHVVDGVGGLQPV